MTLPIWEPDDILVKVSMLGVSAHLSGETQVSGREPLRQCAGLCDPQVAKVDRCLSDLVGGWSFANWSRSMQHRLAVDITSSANLAAAIGHECLSG